jgi:predicted DNA-binding WGR domain protein
MRKPTQLQLPFASISLRRIDAEANCYRFYVLDIERDLFGQTVLARRWGRMGTYGKARFDQYPDEDAAHAALAALALNKQKRGYRDATPPFLKVLKTERYCHDGNSFDHAPIDEMREPTLPF